jgi:hypothetical protein
VILRIEFKLNKMVDHPLVPEEVRSYMQRHNVK